MEQRMFCSLVNASLYLYLAIVDIGPYTKKNNIVQTETPKVNLLVDIQAKLQAGKGGGSIEIGHLKYGLFE